MAQHTGELKTHKCPFCDREFNSSTNFYTHRKNMHPEELQVKYKKLLKIILFFNPHGKLTVQEMKNRALEMQRAKRIRAGVERQHEKQEQEQHFIDDGNDMIVTTDKEDNYILSTVTYIPEEAQSSSLTAADFVTEDSDYTKIDEDNDDEIELIPVKDEHDLVILSNRSNNYGGRIKKVKITKKMAIQASTTGRRHNISSNNTEKNRGTNDATIINADSAILSKTISGNYETCEADDNSGEDDDQHQMLVNIEIDDSYVE